MTRSLRHVPLLLTLALGLSSAENKALAFDHMDSADMAEARNKPIDIGDVFAFRGKDGIVFAMTVNVLTTSVAETQSLGLDPTASYAFNVDANADDAADVAYRVSLTADGKGRVVHLLKAAGAKARFDDGAGDELLSGAVSSAGHVEIIENGGRRLFVGARKEPLFFDFREMTGPVADAAKFALGAYAAGPSDGSSVGTFGPTNATLVMIELPLDELPPRFSVWASVSRNGFQEDRAGKPMTSAMLLPECPPAPSPCKASFRGWRQAYNSTKPSADLGMWADKARQVVAELSSDPALVRSYFLPDVLDVDLQKPIKYPNGRAFGDDAIGSMLHKLDPKAPYTDKASPEKTVEEPPYLPPPVDAKGNAITDAPAAREPTAELPKAPATNASSSATVKPAPAAGQPSESSAGAADDAADARIAVVFSVLAVALSAAAVIMSSRKKQG